MAADANSTTDDGDDGVDLEDLVGRVLDSRGITAERLSSIDGLSGKLEELVSGLKPTKTTVKTSSTPAFDEDSFMQKIGAMVDEKLSIVTQAKPKPLRAWLGI